MKRFVSKKVNIPFAVDDDVYLALGVLSADAFIEFLVLMQQMGAKAKAAKAEADQLKAEIAEKGVEAVAESGRATDVEGIREQIRVLVDLVKTCTIDEPTEADLRGLSDEDAAEVAEAGGPKSAGHLIGRISDERNPIDFAGLQEILMWLFAQYNLRDKDNDDADTPAGGDDQSERPTLLSPDSPTGSSTTGESSEATSSEASALTV